MERLEFASLLAELSAEAREAVHADIRCRLAAAARERDEQPQPGHQGKGEQSPS